MEAAAADQVADQAAVGAEDVVVAVPVAEILADREEVVVVEAAEAAWLPVLLDRAAFDPAVTT